MTRKNSIFLGLLAVIVAVVYVALPYDYDVAWYGYLDDFFVFMAGYTFFMASRSKSVRAATFLKLTAGSFFIIGMLALIALVIFVG